MTTNRAHRLLAGPAPSAGSERLAAHLERLGPLSRAMDPDELIGAIGASGLLGRGGAGFPVGRKWRGLADRDAGPAVVVVNGAEGEPWSAKDRVLMAMRPHLVLDGALLAADAIGAGEIVLYVGEEHGRALSAIQAAVAERRDLAGRRVSVVTAPVGYVSGEASAAVNRINTGRALPTTSPPRPSGRGVHGHPTLVQNVESLAYAALIARFGDGWYRSAGLAETPGTALVTVSEAGARPIVGEIELGATVSEIAARAGVAETGVSAVLLGGYFGSWIERDAAWAMPLDPGSMRARGLSFGCGLVAFLPAGACGVAATATIVDFLARGSAGQCGPCVFGLRAIADATGSIAGGSGTADDLARIGRWAGQVRGRGACHHPDGAAELIESALVTFDDDFRAHAQGRACAAGGRARRVA